MIGETIGSDSDRADENKAISSSRPYSKKVLAKAYEELYGGSEIRDQVAQVFDEKNVDDHLGILDRYLDEFKDADLARKVRALSREQKLKIYFRFCQISLNEASPRISD